LTAIADQAVSAKIEEQIKSRPGSILAVIVVFVVVYCGSLFSPPILDDADATHEEAAREMMVSGDYVTLRVNGVRYLEKAPLPYWLVAGSYRLFGVNEFATRLPGAMAVLCLGLLAMAWAREALAKPNGIYAGLFVFTCAGAYLFTRILIPDVLLSLLIAVALYMFLTALQPGARAWRWYAIYASAALGVLTKGLVALVFISLPIVIFLLITGEWRRWREFRVLTGMAVFIAVAAPWHILAGIRNAHFFWFYFVNEQFLRFLGKRYPHDYNRLPPALYWALHLVWLFPWSFYFPAALRRFWSDWKERKSRSNTSFEQRTRLLCWIWAATVLVFFSFSTNQEYYTFPAYLPILVLLADGMTRDEQLPTGRKWLKGSAAAIAIISMVAGVALVAGLWQSRNLAAVNDIGTVLAKHDMAADTLSMSHALDLSAESFAALRLPATLAAVAFLFLPFISLLLRLRNRHYSATWALALGMTAVLFAAHIALVRFGPYMSSWPLARIISEQATPADKVMIYGDQAFGSSLLFYLRRPIDLVNGNTTSMWFGSTYPDAHNIFLNDAGLMKPWVGQQRIFLFVPAYQKTRVDALLPKKFVVAEISGKFIYSNRS